MADAGSLAAALAGIRGRSADVATAFATGRGGNAAARESAPDVPRLLAAVEAALGVHALTALHRHTEPCDRHSFRVIGRPGCPDCKVIEWTGCEACRDEFGNPARAEDCTTRQAITRELLREEAPGGRA